MSTPRPIVHHGDCLAVLRTLPDESVDAVVTDPPYGLSNTDPKHVAETLTKWVTGDHEYTPPAKGGFMGKTWDSFVPPPAVWDECMRVLKPGGHLLVFAGTRTQDLMGLSIRLAGFDIRDGIGWIYGCLSEDTEVLINGEWVHYRNAKPGDLALCYDKDRDQYEWLPIEDTYEYDYSDTAYRVFSDRTDQIVSRNHRVLIERDGEYVFQLAEEAAREREIRVPILESVSTLLDDLSLPYTGTGIEEPLLRPIVQRQGAGTVNQTPGTPCDDLDCVRRMHHRGVETECLGEAGESSDMLISVQRGVAGGGMEEARPQGLRRVDGRVAGVSQRKDERTEQPVLERRGDVAAGKGQLCGGPIRPLSGRVAGNGPEGRVRDGASSCRCESDRSPADSYRGGASCEPSAPGQQAGESVSVRHESGSQTVRGARFTVTDLARIEPIEYRGKVWCLKVPTGAFVARRNGKVFATGNSGFPKSMDVSKAIDKAGGVSPEAQARVLREARDRAGLSRDQLAEAVGCTPSSVRDWEEGRARATGREVEYITPSPEYREALAELLGYTSDERRITGVVQDRRGDGTVVGLGHSGVEYATAPATPEAERWAGWGTALKPAHEPVVCAQKPFNPVYFEVEYDTTHHLIGALTWLSLTPAKRAELTSPSSPHAQPAATCVSARALAAAASSLDVSAKTATFNSPAQASTLSNIASSWNSILDALSDPTTTSTTSTASSTTTGLRILNSLLAPITSHTTMPACECLQSGRQSSASNAAQSSSDECARWLHTLSASVPESVIEATATAACHALAAIAETLSLTGQGVGASFAPKPAPTDTATSSGGLQSGIVSGAGEGTSPAGMRDGSAPSGARGMRPQSEPVIVARKPIRGTVAANVLAHGTGGINVDACRVGTEARVNAPAGNKPGGASLNMSTYGMPQDAQPRTTEGRFPPNVLLDPDAAAAMDAQSGTLKSGKMKPTHTTASRDVFGQNAEGGYTTMETYGDTGGASRFFPVFKYQAKAPAKERPQYTAEDGRVVKHATVKPLELMRWLVRLVTPAGGVVLDPFAGSGTTGEAAMLEGFASILIEGEAEHLPLIDVRIDRSADDTTPPAPTEAADPEPTPPTLHDRITACTSRAELADLYDEVTATDPAAWLDEHTAAGTDHLAAIERITP